MVFRYRFFPSKMLKKITNYQIISAMKKLLHQNNFKLEDAFVKKPIDQ